MPLFRQLRFTDKYPYIEIGFTISVQSRKRATSGAMGTKRLSLSGNQQVKKKILLNPAA